MYIVEPVLPDSKHSFALRSVLVSTGSIDHTHPNNILSNRGKPFNDYLFQCAGNSEPVVARMYGQHHLAYPIRDDTGCAVAVLDLQIPPTQTLQRSQVEEVTKALKLLTMAFSWLNSTPDSKSNIYTLSLVFLVNVFCFKLIVIKCLRYHSN